MKRASHMNTHQIGYCNTTVSVLNIRNYGTCSVIMYRGYRERNSIIWPYTSLEHDNIEKCNL